MQFSITHALRYRYDRPVFFEPMLIRLCPRHDHAQHLLAFDLQITPTPTGSTQILDAHDNRTRVIWFNGTHEQMQIQSTSQIRMLETSPFDYLVTERGAEQLPVEYGPALVPPLMVFRQRADHDRTVDRLADELRQEAAGQTLEYLRRLVRHIPDQCTQIHREQGNPWPASRTLARREGSCRDLTLLFMELCRAVGLAARFVSGYCTIESLNQANELHAWAEVYVPGGGWRGYDPTVGVATSGEHIALAVAADPGNAAPTFGNYRGTDAVSEFDYEIRIQPEGGR
ncbi:MAG: transglutaminase family protein [Phycisphaeraceae bacterium]